MEKKIDFETLMALKGNVDKLRVIEPVNQNIPGPVYFEVNSIVTIKGNTTGLKKMLPNHIYNVDRALYARLQSRLGTQLFNMTPSIIRASINQLYKDRGYHG